MFQHIYRKRKTSFTVSRTAQKIKFCIKHFFSKCDQIRRKLDLVTFTEEMLNAKLHFFVQWSCLWMQTFGGKNHFSYILLIYIGIKLLRGRFSRFLNCINATKSHNAPHRSLIPIPVPFMANYEKFSNRFESSIFPNAINTAETNQKGGISKRKYIPLLHLPIGIR